MHLIDVGLLKQYINTEREGIKVKKCSHLKKILIVLSILDSQMLLTSCIDVKAADYKITDTKKIYEDENTSYDNSCKIQYLLYESSYQELSDADSKKNDVVKCAYTLIGKPYVYGATGPNEFDCSGLTQFVYKSTGKSISRTTYTQVKEGIEVNRNNLMPGDLVFFNTTGNISHVGIYVGNGSFIHAPRTGKPVMVSSLSSGYYRDRFATARRIFN